MIQPYIKEDSCSLPYDIIKDDFGCDVIKTNNKTIPLNIKNSDLNYQLTIYNICCDEYDYKAFKVTDNIYVFIKYTDYHHRIYGNFNIIDNNNIIYLSCFINDDENVYSLSFNKQYIVLIKSDLDYLDKEIIEAYDIKNKKKIDCDNYNNIEELMNNVVNKKRCRFDVIYSILTGKMLNNESRVYDLLSFLNKVNIDKHNYQKFLDISRKYILSIYPEINKLIINYNGLYNYMQQYNLNYFLFNPIDTTIQNLTYIEDKKKIRK